MPYIQADVAYHTPLQLPWCITTILTCTDQFSAFLISTRSHVDLVLVSTAFTHPLRSSRKEPPNGSGSAIIGGECNNLASVPFQCPIDCRLLIFFLLNSNSNTKLKLNRSETSWTSAIFSFKASLYGTQTWIEPGWTGQHSPKRFFLMSVWTSKISQIPHSFFISFMCLEVLGTTNWKTRWMNTRKSLGEPLW